MLRLAAIMRPRSSMRWLSGQAARGAQARRMRFATHGTLVGVADARVQLHYLTMAVRLPDLHYRLSWRGCVTLMLERTAARLVRVLQAHAAASGRMLMRFSAFSRAHAGDGSAERLSVASPAQARAHAVLRQLRAFSQRLVEHAGKHVAVKHLLTTERTKAARNSRRKPAWPAGLSERDAPLRRSAVVHRMLAVFQRLTRQLHVDSAQASVLRSAFASMYVPAARGAGRPAGASGHRLASRRLAAPTSASSYKGRHVYARAPALLGRRPGGEKNTPPAMLVQRGSGVAHVALPEAHRVSARPGASVWRRSVYLVPLVLAQLRAHRVASRRRLSAVSLTRGALLKPEARVPRGRSLAPSLPLRRDSPASPAGNAQPMQQITAERQRARMPAALRPVQAPSDTVSFTQADQPTPLAAYAQGRHAPMALAFRQTAPFDAQLSRQVQHIEQHVTRKIAQEVAQAASLRGDADKALLTPRVMLQLAEQVSGMLAQRVGRERYRRGL